MTSPPVNPFADATLAARYEDWYSGPDREADLQEMSLVLKLLAGFPNARCILDVGCGTGHFTRWFKELDYETVGLDSSRTMLAEARSERMLFSVLTHVSAIVGFERRAKTLDGYNGKTPCQVSVECRRMRWGCIAAASDRRLPQPGKCLPPGG
jgi:SAM-dependent methyltransferase